MYAPSTENSHLICARPPELNASQLPGLRLLGSRGRLCILYRVNRTPHRTPLFLVDDLAAAFIHLAGQLGRTRVKTNQLTASATQIACGWT
ncbi:MAG: hypothetical protein VYA08_04085 [Pseudomonadota bacterium]|uniref:Uncharacterized protein n=1 Tax=marine metagenome TaxID=408172 RepID=A0A382ESB7_9ZZZZ|nr:hypothetical protein [Pseudomonadota bacterium]